MRNNRRIILLIVVVMLLQLIALPVNADSTSYFSTVAPKIFRVRNSFDLVNTGDYKAVSVKATVLVGAASDSSYQRNVSYKVTPAPKYTYVDSAGNIYAEILIDEIKADETKKIIVDKEVINSGVSYSSDIYRLDADYSRFKAGINNGQYLEPGEKIESGAPEIVNKAAEFNVNQNMARLAKDIYDFVNLYITYNTDYDYANKGALSAIRTAKGVCDEYATLFTALSRAVGLPARVVTGYWLDESLNTGVWNDISSKPHAWAEFYLPNAGWIPVEPTFFLTVNGVRRPDSEHFANFAANDVHLINGYQGGEVESDISIHYSYYEKTEVNIRFDQQAAMPLARVSAGNAFTDISSSWAKDYINKLYNEGILFAKQGSLYKPADNITRAEFSAFLVNTLRLESKDSGITFKDVTDKSDYAAFIKTAAGYGLIKGNPQGYFKPNDTITREDAAVIMQRAIELLNVEYGALAEPSFADMYKISPYAKDSVKLIYSMNIMTGKPGNIFDPKNFTTRAEASKLLDNFINATE
ncbi:MAG: transglutaminase domain protein [Clostridia bacterium]|nr:transglutaminase domain protein [Clostridia bacterium]